MTFTARYHSHCPACDEHISPGDTAIWHDDEVLHALCQDRPAPEPADVCDECWVTKPCFCVPDD